MPLTFDHNANSTSRQVLADFTVTASLSPPSPVQLNRLVPQSNNGISTQNSHYSSQNLPRARNSSAPTLAQSQPDRTEVRDTYMMNP
jgi:hypothetical protein